MPERRHAFNLPLKVLIVSLNNLTLLLQAVEGLSV